MKKIILLNSLFDIYGSFLTVKQQQYFKSYYFENYSLSEIAEMFKVSRTAISKSLHETIEKIMYYEKILKINEKNNKLKKVLKSDDINYIKKEIEKIIK